MIEIGYGRILNVGSTGSFIPSPTDAVYSATKAYIKSFSDALCGEYRKTGIKISTLCPGATQTEFAKKANISHTLFNEYAPLTISSSNNILTIKVPIIDNELKYFYSDYKNYYYLPAEDTAIHKSVGTYVNKDYRQPAKSYNCYLKKES